MKKKLLPLAVLAGLAGGMSTAQAVTVNPDGLGEVLLYPFYSVEGGNDTYINVVNTTDEVKAVKVRVLEAMNSQEVIDFNLYLSPNDHWSAVITDNPNGPGAILRTVDNSCTAPAIPAGGVAFRQFEYAGDSIDGLERTREGYVEIIEMGIVEVGGAAETQRLGAIHNAQGVPANCGAITTAFQAGGVWNLGVNDGITTPEGGLYGYGVLINVAEGTNATYSAVALDDFAGGQLLHTNTGSLDPSLNSADPESIVYSAGTVFNSVWTDGVDAVSAVLMHNNIMNDYVLEPTINAGTDWVITFPTKREYVNGIAPVAPFTSIWEADDSLACEEISITYYDREERSQSPADIDFSPLPPGAAALSLCYEANVLTFNGSNVLNGSDRVSRNIDVDYNNGWMNINFANVAGRTLVDDDAPGAGFNYTGLPVIGFAVQKYVNGTLPGGVLSNYAGLVDHKSTRLIVANP